MTLQIREDKMDCQTFVCGMIKTDCYVIYNNETKKALLIDAPDNSYNKIMAFISEKQLTLEAVVLTHGHYDHILDCYLYKRLGVPLWGAPECNGYIEDPESVMPISLGEFGYESSQLDRVIEDNEIIEILGSQFQFFYTPGHCPGSLTILSKDLNACFTGDLIFKESVGRTDFPGGDFSVLKDSINRVILTRDDSTILYPGHGPSTNVGSEKSRNPFLNGDM